MKIQVPGISISRDFCLIDRNVEGNNPGVSTRFDQIRFLVNRSKKSIQSIESNSQSIKNRKTKFSAESSSDYSESLRTYQAL